MKLETLRYFIEVTYACSINKAAKTLGVPQQTLSKCLKSLENELGVTLLQRSAQGVSLTEAGQDVFHFARWCIGEYERLWPQDDTTATQAKNQLVVAVVETANQLILPKVMSMLYRQDLDFELQVQKTDNQQHTIALVEEKSIDMGIVLCYVADGERRYPALSDTVTFIPLYFSKPYFWVSRLNPLSEKKSLSFKELSQRPFLSSAGADNKLAQVIMGEHGYAGQQFILADNVYYIVQLVKADLGVAGDMKTNGQLSMAKLLEEDAVALPIIRRESYEMVTGAIVHKDNLDRQPVQTLLAMLKSSL